MSQKIFIIVIGVLALLIVSLFGAAYFIGRDTGVSTGEVLRDIFPFGGEGAEAPASGELAPSAGTEGGVGEGTTRPLGDGALRQITTTAVAGATAHMLPTDKKTRVLYVEKATGNIFSHDPQTGVTQRITNTTIPGIQEAVWGKDRVILRYLNENDVIKSWSGVLTATMIEAGTAQRLEGVFLPDDIQSVVSSPDQNQIFYLSLTQNSVVGTTASFSGENKKQIFESSFAEWLPEWRGERTVTLAERPSAGIVGHLFSLNIGTGSLQKILGDLPGLTAKISFGENYVAYSANTEDESPQLFAYAKKNASSLPLPLSTFPEKCAWSALEEELLYCGVPDAFPEAEYPDGWYQGLVSFSDSLWKVSALSGAANIIAAPTQIAGTEIDVEQPFLDNSETHLFFINKKDSALWSLRL